MRPSSRSSPFTFRFSIVLVPIGLAIASLLFWLIGVDAQYLPTAENLSTALVAVALSLSIRNRYVRSVCVFWCLWFYLGALSLFAQNQGNVGLNYNIDSSMVNQYYLYCIISATTAIKIAETLLFLNAREEPRDLTVGRNALVWSGLLVFPLLYAASVIVATGGIPMFSGRNVSSEMYEVDYGPLHAFGIFVTVACIVAWSRIQRSAQAVAASYAKLFWFVLVVCYLIIAAMDGRRALAIFAIFAIILYSLGAIAGIKQRVQVGLVALIGLIGYVAAASVRAGGQASQAFADIYKPLSTVGTEYRDFAYGFVRIPRDQVLSTGYDWFGSTFATLVPGFLATLAGIDKASLSQRDSARTLMQFWNVNLGIRIGLPGELWFAYGWWGILVFGLFGLVTFVIGVLAVRTQHYIYRAILLALLALCGTSVLGQSTVTFGLLLPLLYLTLLIFCIEKSAKRSSPRRVASQ